MIGIDTNILLRFLVDDEPAHSIAARRFMSERSAEDLAYVSAVVLAETIWFLNRRLDYPKSQVVEVLGLLAQTEEIVVEYSEELKAWCADPSRPVADLADYLIAWSATQAGCRKTMTFDHRGAARVPGMELLT